MGYKEIIKRVLVSPFTEDNAEMVNAYVKEKDELCYNKIVICYGISNVCNYKKITRSSEEGRWRKKFGNDTIGRIIVGHVSMMQKHIDEDDFYAYKEDVDDEIIQAISIALDMLIVDARTWNSEKERLENEKKEREAVDIMAKKKRWEIMVTERKDKRGWFYIEFVTMNASFKRWLCNCISYVHIKGVYVDNRHVISMGTNIYKHYHDDSRLTEESLSDAWNVALKDLEKKYLNDM